MGQPAPLTLAAALVLAVAGAEQAGTPKAARRDPGPRAPIAGIAGLDIRSKVRFAASPEDVHDLEVTCAFPERARWMLSAHVEGSLVRELQYLYGEAVYRVPAGKSVSELCEGETRLQILRQLELRRASTLYPDGFEWKGDGGERRAAAGALGVLRARLPSGAAERPTAIEWVDAEGRALEGYRSITWREDRGRSWPATLEFWHGDERVWSETVEKVDATARFVESFFLPPDLREADATRSSGNAIRTLEIPETCSLRAAIASGTSWDEALRAIAAARAVRSKDLAASGLALEEVATVEISDAGEPAASHLRLTTVPASIPAGFAVEKARKGLAVAVEGIAHADGKRVEELRRALPQGAVAGRPYVRIAAAEGPSGRVVLVLPFQPAR